MIKCNCCGFENGKKKYNKSGFEIYGCENCDFAFVYPLPEEEAIHEHYNETRIDPELIKRIETTTSRVISNKKSPKADWYKKVLVKAQQMTKKESLNILEIGSGYGNFIHYCNHNGHESRGTEVTKEYASASSQVIKGNVHFVPDNAYEEKFQNQQFVLEHVLEPAELFESLSPLLSSNGCFIIAVPNHRSLLSRVFGKRYGWTNPPEHLFFYTQKSISHLMNRMGFNVEELWTNDYYHRSIHQFYSLRKVFNKYQSVKGKPQKTHSYSYPNNLGTILILLPYWFVYPIVKIGNLFFDAGNELILVATKQVHGKE